MKIGNKKGFTLIELMIVIAIIGILAITIVPQLTGAQARARDTGRKANVATTRAVLETYYTDEGVYPKNPADGGNTAGTCLSKGDGKMADTDISDLFKNGKAPLDPQKSNQSKPCTTGGSLGYKALQKDGTAQASYIIVTNVETDKMANTDMNKIDLSNYTKANETVGEYKKDKKATGPNSVYAELY